ncbi:MAG: hypothetical protein ACOC1X_03710 [Promethearchaeota archaeon]
MEPYGNFNDPDFRDKLNELKKKIIELKERQPYLLIGIIALAVILLGKYILMLIPVALMVLGSIFLWRNLW